MTDLPRGRLTLTIFATCPECGVPWESDHRTGGRCPGRPPGCTCRHNLEYHRRISGCSVLDENCPCIYGRRPTDYSGEDWKNREDDD